MIIRRFATSQQLITQPAHAALAARLIRQWGHGSLPDSPRKASIMNAVEQHDSGWSEIDETLVLDGTSGNLVREIVNRPFASAAEARRVVASAPTVRLKRLVKDATRWPAWLDRPRMPSR